jgi:tRNA1(Val) A37 N6-methylase TrmN6
VSTDLTTTCDAFLNGRVLVKQPEAGFRSGLDAVFLAAACPAQEGARVLEAGCGAGVASLCLLARVPNVNVTGVEVDAELAKLAHDNALTNGFAGQFSMLNADLTASWSELEASGLERDAYDHVMANPPFYIRDRTRASPDERNARSRAMSNSGLEQWLRFLAAVAKPGGTCTLIHMAEALPQLLAAFGARFGGLQVIPLYPRAGENAIRVIIRGKKGSRAPLSLTPGIVLHEDDGAQTWAAQAVLRMGHGISATG